MENNLENIANEIRAEFKNKLRASPELEWCPACSSQRALRKPPAVLKTAQKTMEIGGGILLTRPGTRDLANPKIGPLLKKYHQGRDGVSVDDRIKMARLAEILSGLSCVTPILSVIAAAPPAVNRLQIRFQTDFERNVKAAKRLAGITE